MFFSSPVCTMSFRYAVGRDAPWTPEVLTTSTYCPSMIPMTTTAGMATSVPAFIAKLWHMVSDESCDDLICWSEDGSSFVIKDQARFCSHLLPRCVCYEVYFVSVYYDALSQYCYCWLCILTLPTGTINTTTWRASSASWTSMVFIKFPQLNHHLWKMTRETLNSPTNSSSEAA